jgi:hypothetical protein
MSEKRKPICILYARKIRQSEKGKLNKVEIFRATDWAKTDNDRYRWSNLYRLRVNGKWYDRKGARRFLWKTEIRDLFYRSYRSFL